MPRLHQLFSRLSLLLGLLVLSSAVAAAQSTNSIIIDPIKENLSVSAGDLRQTTLSVTNDTADAKLVEVTFEEFTVDNSGVPQSLTEPSEQDPANWFTANPASFTLESGATQAVTFTIAVPDELPEQGYYVAAVSTVGAAEEQAASNTTKQEIQSLYSLTVGSPDEQLEILQLDPSPSRLTMTLKNTAGVHVAASGKVDVMVNGTEHSTYTVDPVNVFPGRSRVTTIELDEDLPENFDAKVTLAYGRANKIITASAAYPDDASGEVPDEGDAHSVTNKATVVSSSATDWKQWLLVGGSALVGLGVVGAGVYLWRRNA